MTVVHEDEQYYEDPSNRDIAVILAKDVGWPNDDERVLAVMKELEGANGKDRLPVPPLANQIDIFTN